MNKPAHNKAEIHPVAESHCDLMIEYPIIKIYDTTMSMYIMKNIIGDIIRICKCK